MQIKVINFWVHWAYWKVSTLSKSCVTSRCIKLIYNIHLLEVLCAQSNYWWLMVGVYLVLSSCHLWCPTYWIHYNCSEIETEFLLWSTNKMLIACLLPCRRSNFIGQCLSLVFKAQRMIKWTKSGNKSWNLQAKHTYNLLQEWVMKVSKRIFLEVHKNLKKSILSRVLEVFIWEDARKTWKTHLNSIMASVSCLIFLPITDHVLMWGDLRQKEMCSLEHWLQHFKYKISNNASIVRNEKVLKPKKISPLLLVGTVWHCVKNKHANSH